METEPVEESDPPEAQKSIQEELERKNRLCWWERLLWGEERKSS